MLVLHGKEVQQVEQYKYLGTIITNTLDWTENTLSLRKKANQRLYFLRKLNNIRVDRTIMVLFYQALIQSVITFNLVCYHGNATHENRYRLDQVRRRAQRIIGRNLPEIGHLYEQRVKRKTDKVRIDQSHPLNGNYSFNRSGFRLRVPRTNRTRFRHSFIPNSIHMFNQNARREHDSY